MLNDRLLAVRGRAANVYINLRIDPMPRPPANVCGSINHYTQISILWAALHLIDSERRILVSISQKPEDTIKWYAEAFSLNGWDTLPQFVPPHGESMHNCSVTRGWSVLIIAVQTLMR
jgi:hypothetical protein